MLDVVSLDSIVCYVCESDAVCICDPFFSPRHVKRNLTTDWQDVAQYIKTSFEALNKKS